LTTVTIGVHLEDGFERLEASLAALRSHTTGPFELVVIPDGTDATDRERLASSKLASLGGLDQRPGAARCFNLLTGWSGSNVIVFLEAGSLPGPGWLDRLLEALYADSHNGLAGPSTNFAWNEQCAFARASSPLGEVARTADAARVRFGERWRTLQPRQFLSDFCLALRSDVVQAVGPAHDDRGVGHAWEVDYANRAAQAGFHSVWACSSYVWRSPSTARRKRDESQPFRPTNGPFVRKLWAMRQPGGHSIRARATFDQRPRIRGLESGSSPLVSCVMATCNRREYAVQSVGYFERQDYPNKELIVVDDGADDLVSVLPPSDRIRYVRAHAGSSIGAKRNRGCELARGTVVAQWDDDDWYSPQRLSRQVAPLIAGQAEITGLKHQLFFDIKRWRFWSCLPALHRQMFVEDVLGGTLVYLRACWEQLARYPDCSLAEDAAFLRQAVLRGARLKRITEPALLLYLRHYTNTWQFECGQFIDPGGWAEVPEPALPNEDRAFYIGRSSAALPTQMTEPLVSCIMPTADRRRFIPHAIRYFLRQTYPNRELLIIDDGSDNIGDLVPASHQIRHIRLDRRQSLGAKRNLGCELARGEIIAHWDDDDWIADWRLAYQVGILRRHHLPAVCGLSRLRFSEPSTGKAWMYGHPPGRRGWVAGGTLCYHKSLWRRFQFADVSDAEDTLFIANIADDSLVSLVDNRFYVATVHGDNTSRKVTKDPSWQSISSTDIRAVIGEDWASYEAAAS
jgi:O-antigen biosynthesis protein